MEDLSVAGWAREVPRARTVCSFIKQFLLNTMDPAACKVIYIDERFNTERLISREGLSPDTPQRAGSQVGFSDLPVDLQANVNAFLTVFNQGKRRGAGWETRGADVHVPQYMSAAQEGPSLANSPSSMIRSGTRVHPFSPASTWVRNRSKISDTSRGFYRPPNRPPHRRGC